MRDLANSCALLCAVLLGGCTSITDLVYEGRTPFDPPEQYEVWWAEVAACSDRKHSPGVKWFLADLIDGSSGIRGQWVSNREITIKRGHEGEFRVVKHEMLHDLLGGDGRHESVFWNLCERFEGDPAEKQLDAGTFDVWIRFAKGYWEEVYTGTITISSVSRFVVEGHWQVQSEDGSTWFDETPWEARWGYFGYEVPVTFRGARTDRVYARLRDDGPGTHCGFALTGGQLARCRVER